MAEIVKTRYTVKTHGRADFCAAVISDTHEADPEPIVTLARAISPDVIILAGDIIEAKTKSSARRHQTGAGAERSRRLLIDVCYVAPVYYGLGNHEANLTDTQRELIASTDAHLLEGAYEKARIRGADVVFGAVSPRCDDPQRFLESMRRQNAYRVLICHRPEEYMERYRSRSDDIVFAGHAHGGQWRIFGRGMFAPGQGIFPRYTKGFYGNLLVSAGAHNSEILPRINNKCEILEVNFVR